MTWTNDGLKREVEFWLQHPDPLRMRFGRPRELDFRELENSDTPFPPGGPDIVDGRTVIEELFARWKGLLEENGALQTELAAYELRDMLATIKAAKQEQVPEGTILN